MTDMSTLEIINKNVKPMDEDLKTPGTETEGFTHHIFPPSDLEDSQRQSWLAGWRWSPTSMSLLRAVEKKILSYVKTGIRGHYVDIGRVVEDGGGSGLNNKLWTISLNEKKDSQLAPLLLLHGLGSGVALWVLNLDSFANSATSGRTVHAFDILGFGRSSRPKFNTDPLTCERELVSSIEEWRRQMGIEKFVLLGHSMGGFLATSYAIRYPSRISHLILADPWGFPEKPADISQRYPIPGWVKVLAYLLKPLNPLWGLRAAGPMGPKLVERFRPDLIRKFDSLNSQPSTDGPPDVGQYIYHCNAQNPSGEAAFHSMMSSFGWAKYPQINRIPSLKKEVPMTLIYGSRSWVDHSPGEVIKTERPLSYVDVQVIQGAGHHVYVDKVEEFNDIVCRVCRLADEQTTTTITTNNTTTTEKNHAESSTNNDEASS